MDGLNKSEANRELLETLLVTTQLLLSGCFLVNEVGKLLGQVGGLKLPEASDVGEGRVAFAQRGAGETGEVMRVGGVGGEFEGTFSRGGRLFVILFAIKGFREDLVRRGVFGFALCHAADVPSGLFVAACGIVDEPQAR